MGATENFIKVRNAEGGIHRLAAADLPTGSGTYTDEQVRDVIGAALVAGANVTITVNDAGDTITIAATSSGGTNYWKLTPVAGGNSLQVNLATATSLKEWYAFVNASQNTYIYMSDFGTGPSSIILDLLSEGSATFKATGGNVTIATLGANHDINITSSDDVFVKCADGRQIDLYSTAASNTVYGEVTVNGNSSYPVYLGTLGTGKGIRLDSDTNLYFSNVHSGIWLADIQGDLQFNVTGTAAINNTVLRNKLATASVTGATTVNAQAAMVHKLTMTGNITLTLSGAISGAMELTLYLVQDATGSRTVTWPSSVKWPGSIVPVLSTVGNSVDIVVMETIDSGTTWYANLAGKDYR